MAHAEEEYLKFIGGYVKTGFLDTSMFDTHAYRAQRQAYELYELLQEPQKAPVEFIAHLPKMMLRLGHYFDGSKDAFPPIMQRDGQHILTRNEFAANIADNYYQTLSLNGEELNTVSKRIDGKYHKKVAGDYPRQVTGKWNLDGYLQEVPTTNPYKIDRAAWVTNLVWGARTPFSRRNRGGKCDMRDANFMKDNGWIFAENTLFSEKSISDEGQALLVVFSRGFSKGTNSSALLEFPNEKLIICHERDDSVEATLLIRMDEEGDFDFAVSTQSGFDLNDTLIKRQFSFVTKEINGSKEFKYEILREMAETAKPAMHRMKYGG